MRILIMMEHLNPWTQPIALSLKSLGNEIHVFDFKQNGFEDFVKFNNPSLLKDFEDFKKKVDSVNLISAPTKGKLKYILGVPKLLKIIRKIQPDIILALYGGGYARMAYLSRFRPYSAYLVGSDVLLANSFFKKVNRFVFKSAAFLFVNGEFLLQQANKQVPAANYHPLLFGINPDLFEVGKIEKSPIQIICTRRISPIYNNEMIIESIARMPTDIPSFKMIFVSAGPSLESCKSLADRILSPQRRACIEFWGGVTYHRIIEVLKDSHIYISMSRSDGTSTSLLEALASGLYPILSDIPQNREWIIPGKSNGALVPIDDFEAGAKILTENILNIDHCISMRNFNRNLVMEKANSLKNIRIISSKLAEIVKNYKNH